MILFLFYSLIPFFPFFFVFFIFLSKLGAEQKQCETRRRKTSTSIYRKELLTVRTRIPFLSLLNRRPFCLLRARYSVPVIFILRPHTAQFRVDSIDILFFFFSYIWSDQNPKKWNDVSNKQKEKQRTKKQKNYITN
jgi:hypothetical protein